MRNLRFIFLSLTIILFFLSDSISKSHHQAIFFFFSYSLAMWWKMTSYSCLSLRQLKWQMFVLWNWVLKSVQWPKLKPCDPITYKNTLQIVYDEICSTRYSPGLQIQAIKTYWMPKLTAAFASTLLECLHYGSLPAKFRDIFPTRHLLPLDQNLKRSCYSDCFVFFNSSFSVWYASSYFQNVYRNNKLPNNHHCHSFW